MAIKALKQSVSISETQKMIHQWKRRGVNDPTITKLLDLYLGMPAYMNSQGIYPHCTAISMTSGCHSAFRTHQHWSPQ